MIQTNTSNYNLFSGNWDQLAADDKKGGFNKSFLTTALHIHIPQVETYKYVITKTVAVLPAHKLANKALLQSLYLEFALRQVKFNTNDCFAHVGKKTFDNITDLPTGCSKIPGLEHFYAEFRFPVAGKRSILEAMGRLNIFREKQIELHYENDQAYFSYCSYADYDFLSDEKMLIHLNEASVARIAILIEAIFIVNQKITDRNEEIKAFTDQAIAEKIKQISLAA